MIILTLLLSTLNSLSQNIPTKEVPVSTLENMYRADKKCEALKKTYQLQLNAIQTLIDENEKFISENELLQEQVNELNTILNSSTDDLFDEAKTISPKLIGILAFLMGLFLGLLI